MSPAVWDQSQGVRIVVNASVQTDRQTARHSPVCGWLVSTE